jgi:hypothetical protein
MHDAVTPSRRPNPLHARHDSKRVNRNHTPIPALFRYPQKNTNQHRKEKYPSRFGKPSAFFLSTHSGIIGYIGRLRGEELDYGKFLICYSELSFWAIRSPIVHFPRGSVPYQAWTAHKGILIGCANHSVDTHPNSVRSQFIVLREILSGPTELIIQRNNVCVPWQANSNRITKKTISPPYRCRPFSSLDSER